jgi:hypothetical protein
MDDSEDQSSSGENSRQVAQAYDWLSDHGQPSYEQVMSLAEAGTDEAIEHLHQLADDNDVSYDDATDLTELAQQVYAAISADDKTGIE